MTEIQLQKNVEAVRRFNRFYTKKIGLLNQGLLNTQFPLTQARIIFELAQHKQSTASKLNQELELDPGYLSRILSSFEKDGLIQKNQSKSDNRQWHLKLTARGRKAFSVLNSRSAQEVQALLKALSLEDQNRLLHAMNTFEELFEAGPKPKTPYILRPHKQGDIGWIAHRHGVLYAEEYGFDITFEALVADILAKFIQNFNPQREYLWIAEKDGERIGSVMIVDAGEQVAQLRLLLVESRARGMGVGKHLIEECIDFSKRCGYNKIKLWTQGNLDAARHLYTKFGFKIVEEKCHTSFGHKLLAEIWELPLRAWRGEPQL